MRTDDGVELAAWSHIPVSGQTRAAAVVVHGFGGSMSQDSVVAQCMALCAEGFAVVAYDSRGHGVSGGICTIGDLEQHDVAAAVRLARTLDDRVILIGASMGSIAVLRYAQHDRAIQGLVVVSGPAEWQIPWTARGLGASFLAGTPPGQYMMWRHTGTRVSREWKVRDLAPPIALVARANMPVAIVHGLKDRLVRPQAAHALYRHANEPRSLLLIQGMGHAFGPHAISPITSAAQWALSPDSRNRLGRE